MTPPGTRSVQAISSIAFVQVYSPFVWGRTSVGGLNVTVTLESAAGALKAVAAQTRRAAPDNYVKVDRTQLYWETIFQDPAGGANVNILPGDRVHVVTTGLDPATGLTGTDDRRVIVDNVRAWSSYGRDVVWGSAPPGASVVVTNASSLGLGNYLTPGSSVTYREVSAGADGQFVVDTFRTSTSATQRRIDLRDGSTGFVRVRHADGSEVFTVHGQNVFVLQDSRLVHGYGFKPASAPSGLESGVALSPRPEPSVEVLVRHPGGVALGVVDWPSTNQWTAMHPHSIGHGDSVEVTIGGAPTVPVTVPALTADVDLAAGEVRGIAPAGAPLIVSAGRISGYISRSSTFDYTEKVVTPDAAGSWASGRFQCGSTRYLELQPGSFGYIGVEDAAGAYHYQSFASPTLHAMVDFPYVEGWIGNGSSDPRVRVDGGTYDAAAPVSYLYMTSQRLYINTFFRHYTAEPIRPGQNVSIAHPTSQSSVNVVPLTANIDPDGDVVVGEAAQSRSAALRVIPASDRSTRFDATVDGNGMYTAGQPFTSTSMSNCAESPRVLSFDPGDGGRVYMHDADGDAVFAGYGRSAHVTLNENYVEVFAYPTRGIDWDAIGARNVNLTLTPVNGTPFSTSMRMSGTSGRARLTLTDASGGRVLVRAADALSVAFDEGPDGNTRPASIDFPALPLVTASPDLDNSSLAGVGPRGWTGRAVLTGQPNAIAPTLTNVVYSAYPPVQFVNAGAPVPLVPGYAGTVSFTDRSAKRVWSAWSATATPVRITSVLRPDDVQVCGTAAAGSTVRIHDASDETRSVQIGVGATDGSGRFCVSVTALRKGQVLLAEADGAYSQPVVIGNGLRMFIGHAPRNAP